ncbi:MAG: alpha/beta fold hydrolase [Deltaproteobacteria bacterium]|nr:MAG: alpha/beta fold hydrolase [Deltaproteobacteria bacterium]
MEEKVTFLSNGLKLSGIVHTPDNLRPGERRPAFVVLHGFGGNKGGHGQIVMAEQLTQWGYITMRIDFRGCGESKGEHGRIICLDQVEDASNAVTYMASRPDIDPQRIALVGSSFGAAVAIYTGGADTRVAAVISSGGWGDGERKFRGQHPTPEAWARFTNMLEEGRKHRARTGRSLMVPRFDIVPIPERLRRNMSAGSIMEFPAETAQSMYDFRADDTVGNISPRPLLLLHSANDSVTPTHESIELFRRARQPAELYLLSDVDHFMFNQENPRVTRLVADWLERFFPVHKG